MSKPYYYDELSSKLQDLREFEITCNRFGYLTIKGLSEDQNEIQEICDEMELFPEDYHIETL